MNSIFCGWFKVREDLSSLQRSILVFCSFLLPFLIWAFFAYLPGIWEVSYQLKTTTDLKSKSFPTIYRTSHTMEEERFKLFQGFVRDKNKEISNYYSNGELPEGIRLSTRSNKKVLRKIHPLTVEQKLLGEDQATDDAALYTIWKQLASGELKLKGLNSENLEIIRSNWTKLEAACGENYDKANFPKEPLLHLIPVGVKAVGRPSYLPAPHEAYQSGVRLLNNKEDSLWDRYFDSLRIVFLGFIIACVIGVPIGLLAGIFDFFSKLFEPFVDFFRYLPAPAFGTLLVFLLGSHDPPKIALVFLGTVCQAILMTANTTRQLDKNILDAAQTLGAKKNSLIFKVAIPGIIHNLYNDLRILLGWSWTWLVIAELMGVKSGLTEIIDTQGRRFNFDIVYAVILMIGVTGFVTDQILAKLYPILFPWASPKGKSIKSLFAGLTPKKA